MKRYKQYYFSNIISLLTICSGITLAYLGITNGIIFVDTSGVEVFPVNFCLLFGILLVIAGLMILITNQDKTTLRYYKKIKIPVRDFSLIEYANLHVIVLDCYAWGLDPYSKRKYDKLIKTNDFVTVTTYFNKNKELIKKYLDI